LDRAAVKGEAPYGAKNDCTRRAKERCSLPEGILISSNELVPRAERDPGTKPISPGQRNSGFRYCSAGCWKTVFGFTVDCHLCRRSAPDKQSGETPGLNLWISDLRPPPGLKIVTRMGCPVFTYSLSCKTLALSQMPARDCNALIDGSNCQDDMWLG